MKEGKLIIMYTYDNESAHFLIQVHGIWEYTLYNKVTDSLLCLRDDKWD